MIEFLAKWGIWGAVGFVLGVFLVHKAAPHSDGGTALLLAIGLAAGLILGGLAKLVRWLLSKDGRRGDK